MKIVAEYSFNGGREAINEKYPDLLAEIRDVVQGIDAHQHKTKESKESTKKYKMLFSPSSLNGAFKEGFAAKGGWAPVKVQCDYSKEYYVDGYEPKTLKGAKPYREMDFVKNGLGVEVQFGKYAFMVYNVCAKMTIFKNLGHIDCGVEIVPVRGFTTDMSTGVAYFEQFTWDLATRKESNIDIPVLILGIDADTLITAEDGEANREPDEVVQSVDSDGAESVSVVK